MLGKKRSCWQAAPALDSYCLRMRMRQLLTLTMFAMQGLKPFQVIGDLTSVFGDQQHVADIFSTAVVPGQHITLEQLQHGMKLGTLNGHTVTVSVIK